MHKYVIIERHICHTYRTFFLYHICTDCTVSHCDHRPIYYSCIIYRVQRVYSRFAVLKFKHMHRKLYYTSIHCPSFFYHRLFCAGSQGSGGYPSRHQVRGGLHSGQVATSSYRQTITHTHIYTSTGNLETRGEHANSQTERSCTIKLN